MIEQQRQGRGDMTLTVHCAVFGTRAEAIRRYEVGAVRPYAQYPCSVSLSYWLPRKRIPWVVRVVPENLSYYTIESGGHVLYDSRHDVPCDMDAWSEIRECRQPAIDRHTRNV